MWQTDFALSNDGNRLAISETGLSGYGIAETTRVFQLENENWVEMNYEDQISYSNSLSFSSNGEILISGNIEGSSNFLGVFGSYLSSFLIDIFGIISFFNY